MDRRTFIKAGTVAAAVTSLPAATGVWTPAGAAPSPRTNLYRDLVPEIFAPLPDPPDHSPALVIGSGFGGAISALRLAQAGVSVTMLERGSHWPNDPWRDIFSWEGQPDGRGVWHRDTFSDVISSLTGVAGPIGIDDFGGVLCIDDYPNMRVLRGAAVGGSSIVYTGVSVEPEQRFFEHLFAGVVDYRPMHEIYYPRVREMLRIGTMPADVYNSRAFAHSRAWDFQARRAGYQPKWSASTWNWDVIRAELTRRSRPSAIVGRSTMGNSNGAKIDLNQTYLRYARQTGRVGIYPGHQVESIGVAGPRFTVAISKLAPTGDVLRTRTLTCDKLFLCAGSIGTSELLVRARATGTLPNLNEHTGQGWGPNGNVVMAPWTLNSPDFGLQGASVASRILDETSMPTTLENFAVPATPVDLGMLVVIGLVLDDTRGSFGYDAPSGRVVLDWPERGGDAAVAAAGEASAKVAAAGVSILPATIGYGKACSHPLGGAVIGKVTDAYGRVHGHPGLYVMDGAAVPGNAGSANPSLTVSALAERNIERIIKSGG